MATCYDCGKNECGCAPTRIRFAAYEEPAASYVDSLPEGTMKLRAVRLDEASTAAAWTFDREMPIVLTYRRSWWRTLLFLPAKRAKHMGAYQLRSEVDGREVRITGARIGD